MYIEHNYSYVNKKLIDAGFAALSFHSLRFDRYFTEEEQEQNRAAAEKCGPGNSPEWLARCEETAKEISRQMQNVIHLFEGYSIHQLTAETSTISHCRNDWDLFFYSNRGWNGRDFFDYFTLSANENRTAAVNMELLEKVLAMLGSADIDAHNVRCVVQYTAVSDNAAIENAALAIIEKIAGKMVEYNGIVGKFRKLRDGSGVDCYGFFKKGAKKYGYTVNPVEVVLNGLYQNGGIKEMKNVKVDLYTALSLIKPTDIQCVWIYDGKAHGRTALTVAEIKNKFDMRHTYVSEIRPHFICNEYEGMEIVLANDNGGIEE